MSRAHCEERGRHCCSRRQLVRARGWGPRNEASPNCQLIVGERPKSRIAFGPLARGPRERAMGPLRQVPALESWQTPGRDSHYNPTSLRLSSEAASDAGPTRRPDPNEPPSILARIGRVFGLEGSALPAEIAFTLPRTPPILMPESRRALRRYRLGSGPGLFRSWQRALPSSTKAASRMRPTGRVA